MWDQGKKNETGRKDVVKNQNQRESTLIPRRKQKKKPARRINLALVMCISITHSRDVNRGLFSREKSEVKRSEKTREGLSVKFIKLCLKGQKERLFSVSR